MAEVTVTDNPAESRFEAHVGGELAGIAEYRLSEGTITFTHTEVEDDHEGEGVGSSLVRSALDAVRADGSRSVVPLCPFVKGWIDKHPDYADLVRPAHGERASQDD